MGIKIELIKPVRFGQGDYQSVLDLEFEDAVDAGPSMFGFTDPAGNVTLIPHSNVIQVTIDKDTWDKI